MADIVPVEHVGGAIHVVQEFFQVVGDGRFARGGEPGKPDDGALMAVEPLTVLAVHGSVKPGQVLGFGKSRVGLIHVGFLLVDLVD